MILTQEIASALAGTNIFDFDFPDVTKQKTLYSVRGMNLTRQNDRVSFIIYDNVNEAGITIDSGILQPESTAAQGEYMWTGEIVFRARVRVWFPNVTVTDTLKAQIKVEDP